MDDKLFDHSTHAIFFCQNAIQLSPHLPDIYITLERLVARQAFETFNLFMSVPLMQNVTHFVKPICLQVSSQKNADFSFASIYSCIYFFYSRSTLHFTLPPLSLHSFLHPIYLIQMDTYTYPYFSNNKPFVGYKKGVQ